MESWDSSPANAGLAMVTSTSEHDPIKPIRRFIPCPTLAFREWENGPSSRGVKVVLTLSSKVCRLTRSLRANGRRRGPARADVVCPVGLRPLRLATPRHVSPMTGAQPAAPRLRAMGHEAGMGGLLYVPAIRNHRRVPGSTPRVPRGLSTFRRRALRGFASRPRGAVGCLVKHVASPPGSPDEGAGKLCLCGLLAGEQSLPPGGVRRRCAGGISSRGMRLRVEIFSMVFVEPLGKNDFFRPCGELFGVRYQCAQTLHATVRIRPLQIDVPAVATIGIRVILPNAHGCPPSPSPLRHTGRPAHSANEDPHRGRRHPRRFALRTGAHRSWARGHGGHFAGRGPRAPRP